MTPKDKLISELSVFLHEAFHAGFNAENVSELYNFDGFAEAEEAVNEYAIGRWVSVADRLPDFQKLKNHTWKGIVRLRFGDIIADHYGGGFGGLVTHWLELDLPGGAE